jgi:hypothetical protein
MMKPEPFSSAFDQWKCSGTFNAVGSPPLTINLSTFHSTYRQRRYNEPVWAAVSGGGPITANPEMASGCVALANQKANVPAYFNLVIHFSASHLLPTNALL